MKTIIIILIITGGILAVLGDITKDIHSEIMGWGIILGSQLIYLTYYIKNN